MDHADWDSGFVTRHRRLDVIPPLQQPHSHRHQHYICTKKALRHHSKILPCVAVGIGSIFPGQQQIRSVSEWRYCVILLTVLYAPIILKIPGVMCDLAHLSLLEFLLLFTIFSQCSNIHTWHWSPMKMEWSLHLLAVQVWLSRTVWWTFRLLLADGLFDFRVLNGPNAQKDPKNKNCTQGSSQPMIFPSTWELCFHMFPNSAMTFLRWTECVLGAIWTTQSWPTFREMWPFAMNCFHSTLIADWQKPLSRIKLVGTQNVWWWLPKLGWKLSIDWKDCHRKLCTILSWIIIWKGGSQQNMVFVRICLHSTPACAVCLSHASLFRQPRSQMRPMDCGALPANLLCKVPWIFWHCELHQKAMCLARRHFSRGRMFCQSLTVSDEYRMQ